MDLGVVCGLPRSGSTLLCNLLNQHPQIYASSTSHLAAAMVGLTATHSSSHEVKGELIMDEWATHDRLRRAIRGYIRGWYHAVETPILIDKSRAWNTQVDFLRWVYPGAKVVVCVRDLRSIVASCERRNSETAVFNLADGLLQRGLFERTDAMLAPDGMVGVALRGVQDIIRRYGDDADSGSIMFVKYENFARNPRATMTEILAYLGAEPFQHDFENVKSVARDVDGLYLGKYPHTGSGLVTPREPGRRRWLSPDVEKLIVETFTLYNGYFGYRP